MTTTLFVPGNGNSNGQWPPKQITPALAGTVTAISSPRPFSIRLYQNGNFTTPIYVGGVPVGGAAGTGVSGQYELTGLSVAFSNGLYLAIAGSNGLFPPQSTVMDASGSDLTITLE